MSLEVTIMRTDIALLAGAKVTNRINQSIVVERYILSGVVYLETSFLQCGKVTSREVAGVYSKCRAQ